MRAPSMAKCKGEHDLGKWTKVTATFDGLGDLLHAKFLVAVNSAEPQSQAVARVQRADDVVRDAWRDVGVGCVRMLREQLLRVLVGFLHALESVELFLFDDRVGFALPARAQRNPKTRLP